MIEVTIDKNSGYCFGVEYAIQMAEEALEEDQHLYCLGDIVHNDMEVKRLHKKGLAIINREDLKNIQNARVLIRAHGEPPETYQIALENNLELIDASCPVVLKLQNRVKNAYDQSKKKDGQIVIYGKKGHAEVIGLTGQTQEEAIIVGDEEDLDQIDFSRPVTLFSQTTKSTKGFYHIKSIIEEKIKEAQQNTDTSDLLDANDSICRQVSNREAQIQDFAQAQDLILFVSGKKSSNGKALFQASKQVNSNGYFIQSEQDIQEEWLVGVEKIGICGATSTPMWLMQQVADHVLNVSETTLYSEA